MHRIALTLFLALFLAPTGATADTVAAEWGLEAGGSTYGSFGGASIVVSRGQAFQALVAGRLSSVELRVGRSSDHAIDLTISIYEADLDGLPSGAPLARETFSAAAISSNGTSAPVFFPMSSDVTLQSDTNYVLTAEGAKPDDEPTLFFLNGASNETATYDAGVSCYRIGENWAAAEITDWAFRVTVDESTPVLERSWGAIKAGTAGTD